MSTTPRNSSEPLVALPKEWIRPPTITPIFDPDYPPYPPVRDPTFPHDSRGVFIQALTHSSIGEVKDNTDLIALGEGVLIYALSRTIVERFPASSRGDRKVVITSMGGVPQLSIFALMYRLDSAIWRALPISKEVTPLGQQDCADVFLAYIAAMSQAAGPEITCSWLGVLFEPWISTMLGMMTPTDVSREIPQIATEYMPLLEVEVTLGSIARIIPPVRKLWDYVGISQPARQDVRSLLPRG